MGVLTSPYRERGEPSAMTPFMSGLCDAFFTLARSLSKTCFAKILVVHPVSSKAQTIRRPIFPVKK